MTKYLFPLLLLLVTCLMAHAQGNNVYTYRGIPYGHAERLQPAELVPWDPEGDYRMPGPACPQFREQENLPIDENCLVLTINSPVPVSQLAHATYPVHVHIHGGAYHEGSGENYYTQMAEYTQRTQQVSVTISYRLGAFGYMYLPEEGCVNLGLKDQLLALEWIYRYIGLWGGDRDRITLSGQSAGAQSVVYILAERDRIPIRRAVIFSAPMGQTQSVSKARKRMAWMQEALQGLDAHTCTAQQLYDASMRYEESHRFWGMQWMPTGLEQMPRDTHGIQWPEQVVVTCQAEDGSLFVPKVFEPLATSVVFTRISKQYVRYLKRQGVEATYHEFTWRPHGSKYGAMHCDELPLFIGELKRWEGTLFVGDVTWQEIQPLREQFTDQLGEFVATGRWTVE